MKTSSAVEGWFKEVKPPADKALRRVREIILSADSRLSEYTKYGSVIFGYKGDFASFVQYRKPTVNVMFNRGARIPGKFPHLEGNGPTARFMRFKDVAEANARGAELTKIARAWCDLMDMPTSKSKRS